MTDEARDPAASLGSVLPEQLDAIIEGLERIKELEAEIARLRDESYSLRMLNEMHQQCAERRLAEIDRLRLTDAERQAVAWAARRLSDDPMLPRDRSTADTLRGLLERL
jgi:hypothetical protein